MAEDSGGGEYYEPKRKGGEDDSPFSQALAGAMKAASKLGKTQSSEAVDLSENPCSVSTALMLASRLWAEGSDFEDCQAATGMQAGDLARALTRVGDVLRQWSDVVDGDFKAVALKARDSVLREPVIET